MHLSRGRKVTIRPHGYNAPTPARRMIESLEPRLLLTDASQALQRFSTSPAVFVENQGQWADPSIRYIHKGSGANVLITDSGPVFELFRSLPPASSPGRNAREPFRSDPPPVEATSFSVQFVGANTVSPVGQDQSATGFNYFIGDQSNWRSDVHGFNTVVYQGLYSGIDLQTWGQRDSLKYEFHVAPGADWRQIQLQYQGIEGLSIDGEGALVVNVGDGWDPLRDDAPYVYQEIRGRRVEIQSSFVLVDNSTYRFQIGRYDRRYELIIDPDLAWATYLGGSGADYGYDVAVDSAGNAYVTGPTRTVGWATTGAYDTTYNGNEDVFVAKLNSTGSSLLYATYLGGSSDDQGRDIAVDSAGNAYVTGITESAGWATMGAYDTTHNGSADVFVAKLDSTGGTLLYATYLAGSGLDSGQGIVVDASGNAYVTGFTSSSGWATPGAYDTIINNGATNAFVAKLNSTGSSLLYATYLPGAHGWGIDVDAVGNAYVTGDAWEPDWATPGAYDTTHNGKTDAFVAKLNSVGSSLLYATFLGGSDRDNGWRIVVDSDGNAYVTGETLSAGWATGGAYDTTYDGSFDVFVAKLNSTGGSLLFATYLGGSGDDEGTGIAVDYNGNAYVTGYTNSPGWATAGAYDTTQNGSYDMFVAKLNGTGSTLLYATYLGGNKQDDGRGIALDLSGNAFVTGFTSSPDWATIGAYDTTHNGVQDIFLAKFTPGAGDAVFEFQPQHQLVVQFNDDVGASVGIEDVSVTAILSDGSIGDPVSVVSFGFDGSDNSATFGLPISLANGNYRATIAAAGVTNTQGDPIAHDLLVDFFILAADANRDRKVDLYDLTILATHWQQTGMTFSQGDFDYNGIVNSADLAILATHWQGKLDPPALPSPPVLTSPSPASRAPARTPTRLITTVTETSARVI